MFFSVELEVVEAIVEGGIPACRLAVAQVGGEVPLDVQVSHAFRSAHGGDPIAVR